MKHRNHNVLRIMTEANDHQVSTVCDHELHETIVFNADDEAVSKVRHYGSTPLDTMLLALEHHDQQVSKYSRIL